MTTLTTIRKVSHAVILGAPNAQALIDEYANESANPQLGEPNTDPALYAALEHAGAIQCFGAYEGEVLVGFASLLIFPSPHYGRKVATVESLFVTSGSRPHGVGQQLMGAIEHYAHTFNCRAIFYSAPVGSQLAMLLTASKPYKFTNVVFCRSLASE